MKSWIHVHSPIGPLVVTAEDDAVTGLHFPRPDGASAARPEWGPEHASPVLLRAGEQLREYFAGTRREFVLPLAPRGTSFQLAAWEALRRIPYGEKISYAEQARRLGRPQASRAVGQANRRNPIAIIIPCHRVIGANGALTGFGGGLPTKEALLRLEAGRGV